MDYEIAWKALKRELEETTTNYQQTVKRNATLVNMTYREVMALQGILSWMCRYENAKPPRAQNPEAAITSVVLGQRFHT